MLHRSLRNICILAPKLLKKALNVCCCNSKKLHFTHTHTGCLYVKTTCDYYNNQRLFLYTAVTDL